MGNFPERGGYRDGMLNVTVPKARKLTTVTVNVGVED